MNTAILRATLTHDFLSRFPGPYCYQAGRDGVDDTFDIICLKSGQHIAATYYWSERRACELIAHIVCHALNAMHVESDDYSPFTDEQVTECERQMFCGMHRPPFASREFHCEYRGFGNEVFCVRNEASVICIYETDAAMIADQIATSLNELLI